MLSTMEDSIVFSTPPDSMEAAKDATLNSLPTASKNKYLATYEKFMKWKKAKNASSFSENILMEYFNELTSSYASSSLWSIYSQLKSTLIMSHNVDIKHYSKLTAFLKRQSVGHKPKKSKVLSADNVEQFLNKAPDEIYLATKVALIFGITGACRRDDLCKITVNDVTEHKSFFLVQLRDTKTYIPRSFTITDKFFHPVQKYMKLRPINCKIDRFFLNYQNGKCSQQPIGIHKFGAMPSTIANYLQLPDAKNYTGHSFRRTSATLLANAGADITPFKRHGGCKSEQEAEDHIEDSISNKNRICNKISEGITLNNESNEATSTTTPNNDIERIFVKVENESFFETPGTSEENELPITSHSSNTIINNQEVNLSSLIELSPDKFNLTINNSSVTINVYKK